MGCVTFHLALKFHAPNRASTAGTFESQAPVLHLLQNIELPAKLQCKSKTLYGDFIGNSASNKFSNLELRPSFNLCARVGKRKNTSCQKLNILG